MNKLLIVWSSGEVEVAKKLVLLYSSVMLERKYWDEATIMIWGPSAKILAQNRELQEQMSIVRDSGVAFNACVVCTDDYGVSEKLRELGVKLIHTGEMLTEALQDDSTKVVTF
ncbi:MAG: DsrE family protein [Campylobacterota bacterium]|nr:DsrE family protein [Campylobacterota bacterium]